MLLHPVMVHADTSSATTLYVAGGSSSNCSDSGTGTAAQPYCTIQSAVDVVNPGQTVYIEPGDYAGPIDITRSGTAAAPITITAPTPSPQDAYWTSVEGTSTTTPAIAITNAQYVNISNIRVPGSVGDTFEVSGSSNITLDRMRSDGGAPAGSTRSAASAGFHVTGGSNGVTVQRSETLGGVGIEIDGGSTGTMVSTNRVGVSKGSNSIEVDDAPHTTITSNTATTTCAQSLVVGNGSSAAVIENNLFSDGCGIPGSNTMTLDAAAASSAVADYNTLGNNTNGFRYDWGGTTYATAAAFAAAVGQGTHDTDGTPLGSSTVIDSANSDAPGELPIDLYGRARVDDPVVADTGVGAYSYYDRGALEIQEPLSVTLNASTIHAPIGAVVTFTATPVDAWATSFSYAFDFGDGTKITDAASVETHVYTTTGTYWPTVTVTSSLGASVTTGAPTIDVRAPLVPVLAGGYMNDLTLWVDWLGHTTDGWSPTSATIDFGDCSARFTTSGPTLYDAIHTYAAPGIYTVMLTVQDTGGNTATTFKTYTTPGYTGTNTWCSPTRVLKTPTSTASATPEADLSSQPGPLTNLDLHGIGSPLAGDTVAVAPANSGANANHAAGNTGTLATTPEGDSARGVQYDSEEMAYLVHLIVDALAHFATW